MAFQPIIDVRSREVFAYEALVRGLDGSGAAHILGQVNEDNRYQFDQACRVKAVRLAAQQHQFPTNRLIFEITENERVVGKDHLKRILQEYRRRGFKTAIDDFGAGYAGLNLLAEFQPDIIKLDMELVRHIDTNPVRHAIVQGILGVCKALSIEVIAEGVETLAEYRALRALGIHYFQGYLFAKPAFEQLPAIHWPED